jgi:predicted kinase
MMADPKFQPIRYTNKDEIRKAILQQTGEGWSKKIEKLVEREETRQVEDACSSRVNLIVDNTHGSLRHERRYREIAAQFDYKFEVVNFDTPLAECIRRDKERGADSVGEEVIRRMHRQSFVQPYCPDPALPSAIIVDLDGTLAMATDRGWFEYSKCATDVVIEPVRILINAMVSSGAAEHVIFLTGRDETGREAAERWLGEKPGFKMGETFLLFMKEANSNAPDTETKMRTFEEHIRPYFRVLFVLEDRKRVVEAWREIGVRCFQVAEQDD